LPDQWKESIIVLVHKKGATIKLHKPNIPNKPIINWRSALAYEIVKQLAKMLHNHLYLPYIYNDRNSSHLMTHLQTIELNRDMRICSFDIEYMYNNIPKRDTINIINNIVGSNPEICISRKK
jgi:hypothetical protein